MYIHFSERDGTGGLSYVTIDVFKTIEDLRLSQDGMSYGASYSTGDPWRRARAIEALFAKALQNQAK